MTNEPNQELELAENKQPNLMVNFLFTITEPNFIYGMTLLAVVAGGFIAANVVPKDHLYRPREKNCTVYLQEFKTVNTLDGKREQLSKAINCLDQIQYPQKEDYKNLKNNLIQLNSSLEVDQALQIFQNVSEQKLDQSYIARVTAHPFKHYSWLLFQYLAVAIAFTLTVLLLWFVLVIALDYFFFNHTLVSAFLILIK
ncbi:hypothetical protein [Chroococcus sp. FPU101]|uniref:hypothetical protein n=1 Tax=Chroococcus sp. FPU101 TaxID=1974212 RepID=UPI001A90382E|nr:hypothetical protein [Chroococcus sp. FPU101]GFE69023.1 hypothetical protein CFPU101_16330 [Chroococcus sp. FPU101]